MCRCAFAIVAVLAITFPCKAQTLNLTEKSPLGERTQFAIDLELKGNLIVVLENGKQPIPIEAKAKHRFIECCTAVTDGMPSTTARFYTEAMASATVATEKSERTLSADRKFIIARSSIDGLFCFAPNGQLTRDELDLVTDHFNPQCLPGL